MKLSIILKMAKVHLAKQRKANKINNLLLAPDVAAISELEALLPFLKDFVEAEKAKTEDLLERANAKGSGDLGGIIQNIVKLDKLNSYL